MRWVKITFKVTFPIYITALRIIYWLIDHFHSMTINFFFISKCTKTSVDVYWLYGSFHFTDHDFLYFSVLFYSIYNIKISKYNIIYTSSAILHITIKVYKQEVKCCIPLETKTWLGFFFTVNCWTSIVQLHKLILFP